MIPLMVVDERVEEPSTAPRLWWIPQVLLARAFILPIYRKFAGVPESVELFDELGYGQWLRYAVGTLELALAIGVLVPMLAGLAAIGIVVVMVGAVATELYVESGRWLLPTVLLVLGVVAAWGRRTSTVALLRRLRPGRNGEVAVK
jgi:putative oxidoreductase